MFHIICLSVLLNISFFAHAKIVKIANGEWPPYTSSKLKHGGFLTHIVKEAFETQGYTVQFSYLSWNRGFEMTRLGFFDSTIGWTKNKEREKHFFFSEPIFNKWQHQMRKDFVKAPVALDLGPGRPKGAKEANSQYLSTHAS